MRAQHAQGYCFARGPPTDPPPAHAVPVLIKTSAPRSPAPSAPLLCASVGTPAAAEWPRSCVLYTNITIIAQGSALTSPSDVDSDRPPPKSGFSSDATTPNSSLQLTFLTLLTDQTRPDHTIKSSPSQPQQPSTVMIPDSWRKTTPRTAESRRRPCASAHTDRPNFGALVSSITVNMPTPEVD